MALIVKTGGSKNDSENASESSQSGHETLHVGHSIVNRSARTQAARHRQKQPSARKSRITVVSPDLKKARFNKRADGSRNGKRLSVPAAVQQVAGRTVKKHYIYKKKRDSLTSQQPSGRAASVYLAALVTQRPVIEDGITQNTLRSVKRNAKLRVNGKAAGQLAVQQGVQGLAYIGKASAKYTADMIHKTANADDESEYSAHTGLHLPTDAPHVSTKGLVTVGEDAPGAAAGPAVAKLKNALQKTNKDALMTVGEDAPGAAAGPAVAKLKNALQKTNKGALMAVGKTQTRQVAGASAYAAQSTVQHVVSRTGRRVAQAVAKGVASILSALLGSVIFILVLALILGALFLAAAYSLSSSSSSSNLNGEARIVYQFFRDKGLDNVHAAAIMGNIKQESGMNPAALQSNGEGIGLFQFSYSQKAAFLSYCEQQGASWEDSAELQLNWFWDNKYMTDTPGGSQAYYGWWTSASRSRFESTSDLAEATTIFYNEYEGANAYGTDNTGDKRIQYAQEYLSAMENGSLDGDTDADADGSGRLAALFPDGVPTSPEEMQQYLVTISVPVVDTAGNRGTTSITVHRNLADTIEECFEEMADIGFPVHQAGGYNWRVQASGTGAMSHHSYGVVVDINWTENPASYWGSSPDSGSPYYINQEVVDIWKSHGFYWGGDWEAAYNDPMHFTYTNH